MVTILTKKEIFSFKIKKFIYDLENRCFIMKLTHNEKKILERMIENPRVRNKELALDLNISTQAVGKIRKSLDSKGVINRFETILNYEKININCFALTLVKIMPKAFRKYKEDIENILSHKNIISLINVPQTSITNIILFGFRDISEYDTFFRLLQSRLPGLIEIKESYVFSHDSFIKNSAAELFIETIKEFGIKEKTHPAPPIIKQNK